MSPQTPETKMKYLQVFDFSLQMNLSIIWPTNTISRGLHRNQRQPLVQKKRTCRSTTQWKMSAGTPDTISRTCSAALELCVSEVFTLLWLRTMKSIWLETLVFADLNFTPRIFRSHFIDKLYWGQQTLSVVCLNLPGSVIFSILVVPYRGLSAGTTPLVPLIIILLCREVTNMPSLFSLNILQIGNKRYLLTRQMPLCKFFFAISTHRASNEMMYKMLDKLLHIPTLITSFKPRFPGISHWSEL